MRERRAEIDALLDRRLPLPAGGDPGRLIEAMRYSLLAPGKRLRPLLGLAAAQAVGAPLSEPVRIATAAVELVHCYSLIHDDLPAMDDDDERRGRPTSHKVFGEATAILAGDALLTLAFEWIAEAGTLAAQPGAYLDATRALAVAAGAAGMVRGQARDLGEPAPDTIETIETLHAEKTAALFRAALELGACAGGATPAQKQALARFGHCYGVAFQHADDQADGEHTGLAAAARTRAARCLDEAIEAVQTLGEAASPLRAIAHALARVTGVTLQS